MDMVPYWEGYMGRVVELLGEEWKRYTEYERGGEAMNENDARGAGANDRV